MLHKISKNSSCTFFLHSFAALCDMNKALFHTKYYIKNITNLYPKIIPNLVKNINVQQAIFKIAIAGYKN